MIYFNLPTCNKKIISPSIDLAIACRHPSYRYLQEIGWFSAKAAYSVPNYQISTQYTNFPR
ncbi:MAG: hypothetical protein KME22_08785 [Hassallia sp. WJT32-NPBG1]|nr:hypothetical protein [Hassallia sp. WJT32-NPBG1]